ncbi:alpha-galactosidase [Natronobacillus azotifigens]|uniref:Alpha-galactosidase n=1 Tax=Natronobacillus azotifigens TaxID=472978 RepID=A0A9J6RAW6_9BACI|nr:alpha-galactosidase [Natronobacillus azotifigens]MCZ0702467.1 alpha-galactosidase [Natronobacillus azotifigens]
MSIYFNETTKEFHLQTSDTSYIFAILKNNQLGHYYYGKQVKHRDSFAHLFPSGFRATIANVVEEDHTFSLELIKQEFPSYGTGDFREPAFQLLQANGSRITDFTYQSHQIYQGKKKLENLPATYVEEAEEATTLEISLVDSLIDVEIILSYSVFESYNAITRSVRYINHGEKDIELTRALSMSIDYPDSNYEMIHLAGAWGRERHVKQRKLQPGLQSITSTRGASSSQQNPFLALKRPETTEDNGSVYGFSFVYSGNFLAQVEVDHFDVTRVSIGINPFDFNWRLQSNESFQAPEVVMVYSDRGLNGMSQAYHKLYQSRLARGKWRDLERPILVNNWEGTYFNFTEEKIIAIASEAKQLGVELFVLDDGWFGKRNDDTTSLGDWFVNEEKLPNGITGLADDITKLGMDFGLWFEPEMVSKKSELYKKHPDWLIQTPGRNQTPTRNQHVLDFSRQEVVDYIYESMAETLSKANISYVKWDMNRYLTEIGSAELPSERQQEVAHRYILGVYQLYERLIASFPDVLFESCSSGGARFDPGILYYAPQGWTSDDTDAMERLKIQYGTSLVYPISSMGAHVSAVPNHQVGRMTSMDARAHVAYFGAFGYELDVTEMSEEDKAIMRQQIEFYKETRKLFQYGKFHRISSPFEGNVTSWSVVSADQTEAILAYYQWSEIPNDGFRRIYFTGLNENLEYEIVGIPGTYYGDELMYIGIVLDNPRIHQHKHHHPNDFRTKLYHVKAVD